MIRQAWGRGLGEERNIEQGQPQLQPQVVAHPRHQPRSRSYPLMARFTTDSPLSRRIVQAFLHFLHSVEPGPDVDLEGLEVARECLQQVFNIQSIHSDDQTNPDLLVDMFSSLAPSEPLNNDSHSNYTDISVNAPSSSVNFKAVGTDISESAKGQEWTNGSPSIGVSRDELLGQFLVALEKIHFFQSTQDGNDDTVQLEKATRLFSDALTEMGKSGCHALNQSNLAESLKSLGNKAMQSKLYLDAIELYDCAIALSENNSVYHCNRAAAYTQIHKFTQAIKDCLKSIDIDPHYSKAYSRLGLAYYGQGNYRDAIDKGFMKALQLDPHNEAVKENIRVAEQRLKEEQQQRERDQGSTSSSNQESQNQAESGSRNGATRPRFTSMPFNAGALPAEFASMFMNMAANAANSYNGQAWHGGEGEERHENGRGDEGSGMRIGGNISLNVGEDMPEDLSGALRSMMEMFAGGASGGTSQDNTSNNGRRPPQS